MHDAPSKEHRLSVGEVRGLACSPSAAVPEEKRVAWFLFRTGCLPDVCCIRQGHPRSKGWSPLTASIRCLWCTMVEQRYVMLPQLCIQQLGRGPASLKHGSGRCCCTCRCCQWMFAPPFVHQHEGRRDVSVFLSMSNLHHPPSA